MRQEQELHAIRNQLGLLFGLNFTENQDSSLIKNLQNAATELGLSSDLSAIKSWLSKKSFTPEESNSLAKHLTIGETYFFREKAALKLFAEKIIPELINKSLREGKPIKIWSAGCSSGEEPYSLAILLKEANLNQKNLNISILATDLNVNALNKASKGIYSAWSFRETTAEIKAKYFTQQNKHYLINKEIQDMVDFRQLNLATADFPSAKNHTDQIDVIFCRNVLMYFWPETAKTIAAKFYQALNPYGWLITSQVELIDEYFSVFCRENYANGIFYQKKEKPVALSVNYIVQSALDAKPNRLAKLAKKQADRKVELKRKSRDSSVSLSTTQKIKPKSDSRPSPMQLYKSASYAACIESCQEQLKMQHDNKQLRLLLVKSLANTGQLNQAAEEAEKLMKADAINPEFLNIFANILMELEEWEKAKIYLTKSLYINPDLLATHFNIGYVYQKLGKAKQAEKHFQNLLKDLETMEDDAVVSEMDNMTAGRLKELTLMMAAL
ncbi:MAG: hypothetical protein PF694_07515 [Bacteroidetes bacterium]|jgi:chemotaxis protein methyltransferase CheR|nr:hypothetical protein [Bacteroidota bacterium]